MRTLFYFLHSNFSIKFRHYTFYFTYPSKPKMETVTYRNLMLRKDNIKKINEYHQKTGISFTRLVNGAIKEFFEK